MDFSHKTRTIVELLVQLKLRVSEADKYNVPVEDLGGSILSLILSTDNADNLMMRYNLLSEIDSIANSMDFEEYYRNPEGRQHMSNKIAELDRQVTKQYGLESTSLKKTPAWTADSVAQELEVLLSFYGNDSNKKLFQAVSNFISIVSVYDELSEKRPQLLEVRKIVNEAVHAGAGEKLAALRSQLRKHISEI